MTDQSPTLPEATTALQTQLRAVAQALHEAKSLNPEARAALADFMDELSKALNTAPASSQDLKHLTESATHLLKAAHEQDEAGIPDAVRSRFENAILGVQTRFPNVAALARTLVDALANIGI